MSPTLRLVSHPIVATWLSRLRDKKTEKPEFSRLVDKLGGFLAHAAAETLKTRPIQVETPLEIMEGAALADLISIVPILRAGLGLLHSFQEMFPEATIGYLGLRRNEETLLPECYLNKLPDLTGRTVFVLDPMLATGGSAVHAIDCVKKAGAGRVILVTLIAAPEGVAKVEKTHQEILIYTLALDRQLDECGFIRPGLGDAGDRQSGTATA